MRVTSASTSFRLKPAIECELEILALAYLFQSLTSHFLERALDGLALRIQNALLERHRGVLAGVRYLTRDRLLGPMTLTLVVLDGAANAISVAIPLLAFTRYHRDPHVAGWIFTGFGVGAILGSVLVMKLLDKIAPLRLASIGVVLVTLPLWVIVADVPWPVVCGALFVCGFFVPSVNAPFMGILTTRPPVALRAKVMTAVLTASGLGAPAGRLAIGPIFQRYGNSGTWVAVAGGLSAGALLFVAAAVRGGRGPADLAAVTVADAEL